MRNPLLLIAAATASLCAQTDEFEAIVKQTPQKIKEISITRCEVKSKRGVEAVTDECTIETATYREDGKVVSYTKTSRGKLDDKMTYEYDGRGNLTAKRDYDSQGAVERTELYSYAYDSSGAIVRVVRRIDSRYFKDFVKSVNLAFDQDKNVVRRKEINEDGDAVEVNVKIAKY